MNYLVVLFLLIANFIFGIFVIDYIFIGPVELFATSIGGGFINMRLVLFLLSTVKIISVILLDLIVFRVTFPGVKKKYLLLFAILFAYLSLYITLLLLPPKLFGHNAEALSQKFPLPYWTRLE